MLFALLLSAALPAAGSAAAPAPAPLSAPVRNIRYEVSFTRLTAAARKLVVGMQMDVAGPGDVILSLPDWTPGAYEITHFSRWVSAFAATAEAQPLRWDKLDHNTWRIRPGKARSIRVSFNYQADSLDNAMAWSAPEFLFFNGTNLFLYPEGRGFDFPATVKILTEEGWQVATGMRPGPEPGTYAEKNYHDLVDMPFFVGRFDYDSTDVNGVNVRLATWPSGAMAGEARARFWEDYRRLFAPQIAVFADTPFRTYTTLIAFPEEARGGSALEHQNSHMGIYIPQGVGQTWVTSVTAHEMFHAFNVKRLRPADMVPYRYDAPQPTVWLWVSEGITDYYADLTLLRAGVYDSTGFFQSATANMVSVAESPPVALEDASLSTWAHPTDGSGYIYYPKGSLAGFLLDILIRDASDNRRSLDDVMRELYQTTWRKGLGFGASDWWGAVSRAAGGKSFAPFADRYIDGRDPFPWDSVLPLAALRLTGDTLRLPRLGISSQMDSSGTIIVHEVMPGGAADEAGVEPGDELLQLGDIKAADPNFFERFRAIYGGQEGADLPIRVRRNGQRLTLKGKVQMLVQVSQRLEADPAAGAKAIRIRSGIFRGTVDR